MTPTIAGSGSRSRAIRFASARRPRARFDRERRRSWCRSRSPWAMSSRPVRPLGLLEAMKMEIGFQAPVAGVESEVTFEQGQQVAAGDVILVIDPGDSEAEGVAARASARIELPQQVDPLALLFLPGTEGPLGEPDLVSAGEAEPSARRQGGRDRARRDSPRGAGLRRESRSGRAARRLSRGAAAGRLARRVQARALEHAP